MGSLQQTPMVPSKSKPKPEAKPEDLPKDQPVSAQEEISKTEAALTVQSSGELPDSVREQMKSYFERYDLDDSGTMNDVNELQMVTINACYHLGVKLPPQEIQAVVSKVASDES